jgi:acyl-CoA dehydrogenase
MINGETVTAIAMIEPGAWSDLWAIHTSGLRDGDDYVVSGNETNITTGHYVDLVIVAAKTGSEPGARGLSLILDEADRAGFARGRNLNKIGQNSAEASELFFNNVRVPAKDSLDNGFSVLMSQLPQERLSVATSAQALARHKHAELIAAEVRRHAGDHEGDGRPLNHTDLQEIGYERQRSDCLAPVCARVP